MITLKRVYETPQKSDGFRVLVDRLWPRGLSKEKAQVDLWLKDIAPSTALRKWFGHDGTKWQEFTSRYKKELTDKKELLETLRALVEKHPTLTLVYGAKDTEHNQAVVLKDMLQ